MRSTRTFGKRNKRTIVHFTPTINGCTRYTKPANCGVTQINDGVGIVVQAYTIYEDADTSYAQMLSIYYELENYHVSLDGDQGVICLKDIIIRNKSCTVVVDGNE